MYTNKKCLEVIYHSKTQSCQFIDLHLHDDGNDSRFRSSQLQKVQYALNQSFSFSWNALGAVSDKTSKKKNALCKKPGDNNDVIKLLDPTLNPLPLDTGTGLDAGLKFSYFLE